MGALNWGEPFLNHETGELGDGVLGAAAQRDHRAASVRKCQAPAGSSQHTTGHGSEDGQSHCVRVFVSHYSSLFEITKNRIHSSQGESVLCLMVTGKRSTSLHLDP